MSTNWGAVSKSAKTLRRNYKNKTKIIRFFAKFPEEGYMLDEKPVLDESGNNVLDEHGKIKKDYAPVKIDECRDSTLRRFTRTLNSFYYLCEREEDKEKILGKKIEVESELEKRG